MRKLAAVTVVPTLPWTLSTYFAFSRDFKPVETDEIAMEIGG